jgi:hypothetical protein
VFERAKTVHASDRAATVIGAETEETSQLLALLIRNSIYFAGKYMK